MAEDDSGTAEPRALRLRYPASCITCGAALAKGSPAWWWSSARAVECRACRDGLDTAGAVAQRPAQPTDLDEHPSGSAGASARREYDRRSARERTRQEAAIARDEQQRQARREARPVVGRIVNALVERPPDPRESKSTQAWKIGAAGERRVAEILDATSCFVLHDRRIPNSKANIDHLAVGPAGVFVIDAKKYEDKQLEVRDKGSFFSPDPRLYVAGRDRTKLVDGIRQQSDVVRAVLEGRDVPVHGVLCFVGARWPGILSNKPIRMRGVTATWPVALGDLVAQQGPLAADQVREIGEQLAVRLRPA